MAFLCGIAIAISPRSLVTHPYERYLATSAEDCVQRTLAVAFQIQRDVVKAQRLEDGGELARHLQGHGAVEFFRRHFDAHDVAVESHAELAEAERTNRLFAAVHGLHILNRHRRSVGNPRTEA